MPGALPRGCWTEPGLVRMLWGSRKRQEARASMLVMSGCGKAIDLHHSMAIWGCQGDQMEGLGGLHLSVRGYQVTKESLSGP